MHVKTINSAALQDKVRDTENFWNARIGLATSDIIKYQPPLKSTVVKPQQILQRNERPQPQAKPDPIDILTEKFAKLEVHLANLTKAMSVPKERSFRRNNSYQSNQRNN